MTGARVIIVGGGISGLSAAEALCRQFPGARITLLEGGDRLGGCIRTDRTGGFVLEGGPDLFLGTKPDGVALCERLGIASRLQGGIPGRRARIMRRGVLHPMPEGFSGMVPTRVVPFARTGLISPLGKLRCGVELVVPPRADGAEESVEQFVVRRMGREAYERLVEPLLSGIFAGDGARISVDAAFPQLRAMEREHGGLLRGMLASRSRPAPARGDGYPAMVTFPTGLAEMVEALESWLLARRHLADGGPTVEIRRGARAVELDVADGVRIELAGGETVEGDAVILATPAHVAASLVAPLDARLGETLAAIEYVSSATVSLAFAERDVPRALDGTGYTVPRVEGRAARACTWSSAKFEGRAPAGIALFRVFLGGAGREHVLEAPDDALVAVARTELRKTMGIAAEPLLARVQRVERAMAQYTVGHGGRVQLIEERLAALPRLALAGNAYRGVGIPDCIRSGAVAAGRIGAAIGRRRGDGAAPGALLTGAAASD